MDIPRSRRNSAEGHAITFPTVVTIPARNEEAGLARCVGALCDQRGLSGERLDPQSLQIAILANNCTDRTAERARELQAAFQAGPRIHVRELSIPAEQANAGYARRAAMDWAAELLADDSEGLICTTDADSAVHPDWLARTWAECGRGADAVAGTVEFDPIEAASLVMPEARRLEARFSALQAEIMARLDPEPGDPWPNHIWAWGASLAVFRVAYQAVGGLPTVPLAEDRALVRALQDHDYRVCHSLEVRVTTSCRTLGRAPGGLADLIAAYASGAEHPCDAELQPVSVIAERARCRAFLRSVFGCPADAEAADRLGVSLEVLRAALEQRHFGQAWRQIQDATCRFREARLWPDDLPREVGRAAELLATLMTDAAEDRCGNGRASTAGLWTVAAARP